MLRRLGPYDVVAPRGGDDRFLYYEVRILDKKTHIAKVIPPDREDSATLEAQLKAEPPVQANLQPHECSYLLSILDEGVTTHQWATGEQPGHFVITEHYDSTLAEKLQPEGLLQTLYRTLKGDAYTMSEQLDVYWRLASALSHLHAHGIVHGGINPESIYFEGKQVKLGDFTRTTPVLTEGQSIPPGIMERNLLGKRQKLYRAPEQLERGAYVLPASDVYSLALTMYTWIAGGHPFRRKDDKDIDVIGRMRGGDAVPPLKGIDRHLFQFIAQSLSREPSLRPSIAAVRDELKVRVAQNDLLSS